MAFFLDHFINTEIVTGFTNAVLKKNMLFKDLIMDARMVGALQPGGSYKVPGNGAITIGDYAGAAITHQKVTDTGIIIPIDKKKYFSIQVDKVDSYQEAKATMKGFVEEAGVDLAVVQDADIATVLSAQAGINNLSVFGAATSIAIDETNVIDFLASMKTAYDEAHVPKAGRWLVLPGFAETALAVANVITATTVAEAARTNGFLLNFMGFNLYSSENMPQATPVATLEYKVLAGIKRSAAMVQQVQELEFFRHPDFFSDNAKGLNVYGTKVLRADATASMTIHKAE